MRPQVTLSPSGDQGSVVFSVKTRCDDEVVITGSWDEEKEGWSISSFQSFNPGMKEESISLLNDARKIFLEDIEETYREYKNKSAKEWADKCEEAGAIDHAFLWGEVGKIA